jgi:dTMP kinase
MEEPTRLEGVKMFIVFEGVQGTGKTTQVNILKNKFVSLGIKTEVVKFPSDYRIKELLLKDYQSSILANTLLMAADFRRTIDGLIIPTLKEGKTLFILDRFTWSTKVYQHYANEEEKMLIETILHLGTFPVKPDITFLLTHHSKDVLKERIGQQEGAADVHERGDLDAWGEKYKKLYRENKSTTKMIETSSSPKEVADTIWETLQIENKLLHRFRYMSTLPPEEFYDLMKQYNRKDED